MVFQGIWHECLRISLFQCVRRNRYSWRGTCARRTFYLLFEAALVNVSSLHIWLQLSDAGRNMCARLCSCARHCPGAHPCIQTMKSSRFSVYNIGLGKSYSVRDNRFSKIAVTRHVGEVKPIKDRPVDPSASCRYRAKANFARPVTAR